MIEFFEFITNMILNVVNMISNMVESVVFVFGQLSDAVLYVNTVTSYLPPFCQAPILAIVAIGILSIVLSLFVDLS